MRRKAPTPTKLIGQVKVRMSMSKYNLYNLSRLTRPSGWRRWNFFQLKWKSKSLTRKYHGDVVREGQWSRMFSKKLRSVVSMDPAYLAENDGRRESAGRGSGAEEAAGSKEIKHTPRMLMTFAPLERRLDIAIFRALFASSARQARQFVVHGNVTVNGKEMRFPGYLLNPGDMFQVRPDRVMFAMGQRKAGAAPVEAEEEVDADTSEQAEQAFASDASTEPAKSINLEQDPKSILKDLQAQAKSILSSPKENLGAKRKQDLRTFSQSVRKMLSRSGSGTILTDSLEAQFQEIQNQLKIQRQNRKESRSSLPSEQEGQFEAEKPLVPLTSEPAPASEDEAANYITDTEYNELFSALSTMSINPPDEDKTWATPWMPRDYMSAFAFVPRYLEVNQNICAAVYLRHPVARPGRAEVPTPFSEGIVETAFNWYLRRR